MDQIIENLMESQKKWQEDEQLRRYTVGQMLEFNEWLESKINNFKINK